MFKEVFAVDGLHPAAVEIVVAAIEHATHIGELVDIAGDDVRGKLVSAAPGLRREVFQRPLLFARARPAHYNERALQI